MKHKFKQLIPLLVGIIILLLQAAAYMGYCKHQESLRETYKAELKAEKQRKKDIREYEKRAEELYQSVSDAHDNLLLLEQINDYFNDEKQVSAYAELFDYVEETKTDAVDEEKKRKREIDRLYSELKDLKCKEKEIEQLDQMISQFCTAYGARYKLLVDTSYKDANYKEKNQSSKTAYNDALSSIADELSYVHQMFTEDKIEKER